MWGGADSQRACAMAVSSMAVEVAKEKKEETCMDTVAHFLGIPRVLSLAFVSTVCCWA